MIVNFAGLKLRGNEGQREGTRGNERERGGTRGNERERGGTSFLHLYKQPNFENSEMQG